MDSEFKELSEYELFECRPDGSVIWCGVSQLTRVRRELQILVETTGREFFAMQLRTRRIIFPTGMAAISRRVFQIAYTDKLCRERTEVLRRRGYGVLSMIGNTAAKALLVALQMHADDINAFVIGHAAPEPVRKEMVDWLRSRYAATKILVFNPPGQQTAGADYNVQQNGPEPWLPIIESDSGTIANLQL